MHRLFFKPSTNLAATPNASPYCPALDRAAMPIEKALNIMSGDLGTAIDETCLDGLRPALEKLGRMQAA